ncbi:unnamed protein product [Penicillium pancosmium]
MAIKSLLLLATAALATAESSVVSMFIPDVEGTALVASVIAQRLRRVTGSVPDLGTEESGIFHNYGRMICSLGGTTTAVCTDINSGAGANFPGTHTTTLASSDITSLPVTITAGATTGAASDTSASTTESSTTATSDTTASQTSASSSGAMASSTSSSTGGMSQITGAPVLALGAAVAFVAGAL